MSEPHDLTLLGDDAVDKLAGLVFELAAQLHEERTHRLALQQALDDAGVVPADTLEATLDGLVGQEDSRAAADDSIRRLLKILMEDGAPEAPLRSEAPDS